MEWKKKKKKRNLLHSNNKLLHTQRGGERRNIVYIAYRYLCIHICISGWETKEEEEKKFYYNYIPINREKKRRKTTIFIPVWATCVAITKSNVRLKFGLKEYQHKREYNKIWHLYWNIQCKLAGLLCLSLHFSFLLFLFFTHFICLNSFDESILI